MNFRFYIYGALRVVAAFEAEQYLSDQIIKKKETKKYNKIGWGKSKSGKVAALAQHADKKLKLIVKIGTKKHTIEKILSAKLYWHYRNSILKKDQISNEEVKIICSRIDKLGIKEWGKSMKNNKSEYMLWNKAREELESFHKSVSEYIIKLEKEYNQSFFINYKIEKKFNPGSEEPAKTISHLSDLWKTDHCWQTYLVSR
tara:strand:- start:65 stop:664 length:600 start_codon:yes stop_codon:yes gene_type:complete